MFRSKISKISKGDIKYLDTENGSTNILYLHGGFGGPSAISTFHKNLGNEYRIIAPSLPGHEGSFKIPNNFTYEDFVTSIHEFLQSIHLEKKDLIVIGHSFGARIAWDLSLKKSLSITKLVLLAPLFKSIEDGFLKTSLKIVQNWIVDMGIKMEKPFEDKVAIRFIDIANMKRVWTLIKEMKPPENFNTQKPTLIILGIDDTVTKFKNNQLLVERMQGVQKKTYRGSHYLFLRNADHWQDIRKFLATQRD